SSEKSSWPGVSSRLKTRRSYSNVITEVTTEMPRSRSIAIQSDRVERRSRLALTCPASWMAPPNSSSFSVSVVLPASGWEMMAKVRRRSTSLANGERGGAAGGPPDGREGRGGGSAVGGANRHVHGALDVAGPAARIKRRAGSILVRQRPPHAPT